MKAAEALAISMEARKQLEQSAIQEEYDSFIAWIRDTAKTGDTHVLFSVCSEPVKEKLKNDGYNISFNIISWRDAQP